MFDLALVANLQKKPSKAKKTVLPRVEIQSQKAEGWVIFLNGNRTASYNRYATAELGALIMGAAPWQLDAIWNEKVGEARMDHEYPHLSGLQLLGYEDYLAHLRANQ